VFFCFFSQRTRTLGDKALRKQFCELFLALCLRALPEERADRRYASSPVGKTKNKGTPMGLYPKGQFLEYITYRQKKQNHRLIFCGFCDIIGL